MGRREEGGAFRTDTRRRGGALGTREVHHSEESSLLRFSFKGRSGMNLSVQPGILRGDWIDKVLVFILLVVLLIVLLTAMVLSEGQHCPVLVVVLLSLLLELPSMLGLLGSQDGIRVVLPILHAEIKAKQSRMHFIWLHIW